MQKYIATGRLTRDVEIRVTANGQSTIGRFTLAINRGKNKDGTEKEPIFLNYVVFDRAAELFEQYAKKGSKVYVEGKLEPDSYTSKEGNKVFGFSCIVTEFEFLDSKKSENNTVPITNPPQQNVGFTTQPQQRMTQAPAQSGYARTYFG